MPELPEVETLRRELTAVIKGKIIESVEVKVPKMVSPLSVAKFSAKIKNKKIIGVLRRAKILIIELSSDLFLLIHLKLTGQLIYKPSAISHKLVVAPRPFGKAQGRPEFTEGRQARDNNKPRLVVGGHPQKGGVNNLPNQFTHIIFTFSDGSKLFFNDLRKFGWIKLVDKLQVDNLLGEFGIEPLTKNFSLEKFKEILKKYPNRKIKQILMDQTLIAGVGNIYADESCFCAKINPTRIVKTLKEKEIKDLYHCIPKILELAIEKKGTSVDTYIQLNGQPGGFIHYLKVYGRKNEKCKRCSGIISKIKLNGRGTHFCPRCQS